MKNYETCALVIKVSVYKIYITATRVKNSSSNKQLWTLKTNKQTTVEINFIYRIRHTQCELVERERYFRLFLYQIPYDLRYWQT